MQHLSIMLHEFHSQYSDIVSSVRQTNHVGNMKRSEWDDKRMPLAIFGIYHKAFTYSLHSIHNITIPSVCYLPT